METTTTRTAAELQVALRLLYIERALAELQGLGADPGYMDDLLDDIHSYKAAFAGTVVTEIATLRAELSGPLRG
jgi:hypothetical protein